MFNKKKKVEKVIVKIDIAQLMLKERNIFIYGTIQDKTILPVIQTIYALDSISHKPINLWLNSCGGSCNTGLALINVIRMVKSKIITIVNSEVCSMGAHISIAGNERLIVPNGVVMFHDMSGGITGDYSLKVKDRAKYVEKYYQLLEANIRKYTKLSEKEIRKARTGELWLFAKDCIKKGVADKIIK